MRPKYDFDKIRFATDAPTFKKAVDIYEGRKIINFKDTGFSYTATVLGTMPYQVKIFNQHFDDGYCNCYLGQHETLCKHLVAVAIMAVKQGELLSKEEKEIITSLAFSGKTGELSKIELKIVKKEITANLRLIKPYLGPSRIWFAYQRSLEEGCNRLSALICKLPASPQTGQILVDLLLRLDRKLTRGGVDDSDGTVGGFIEQVVEVLKKFAVADPICTQTFKKLENQETCFGWEEELLKL